MPTYVLSECVLVYMEPRESAALLSHLGQQLPSAVCVVYEQVAASLLTGLQIWQRALETSAATSIVSSFKEVNCNLFTCRQLQGMT